MNPITIPQSKMEPTSAEQKEFLLKHPNRTIVIRDVDWNEITIWDGKNKKPVIIDRNSLRNLIWLSEKAIFETLEQDLWIDIETEEGIDFLNICYQEALRVYNGSIISELQRKKWANIDNLPKEIKNKEELLALLEVLRTEANPETKLSSEVTCVITKIASSIWKILNKYSIIELKSFKDDLINTIINLADKKWWKLEKNTDNCYFPRNCYYWNLVWHNVSINWRVKSIASIVYKQIWQVGFIPMESIPDVVWLTIVMEKWNFEWAIKIAYELMKMFQKSWKLDSDYDLKTKFNWYDEMLKKLRENEGKEDLALFANKVKYIKKEGSADKYSEYVKMQIKIDWTPVEIKITNWEERVQDGIWFQWIYSSIQKHIEWFWIRQINEWYVDEEDLAIVANYFFEKLPILLKENPEKTNTRPLDYLKELADDLGVDYEEDDSEEVLTKKLKPKLIEYYKSRLVETKLENGKKVWSSKMWIKEREIDFHKAV